MLRMIVVSLIMGAGILVWEAISSPRNTPPPIETPHDVPTERLERKGRCSGGWDFGDG